MGIVMNQCCGRYPVTIQRREQVAQKVFDTAGCGGVEFSDMQDT